jgi:short-subunit dehydrogenase
VSYAIIGGSAGVGRALAAQLAASGHDLILVSSDARDLRAVASDLGIRYGARVATVAADVTEGDAYLDQVARAAHGMGALDGLLFPLGVTAESDDGRFDPVLVGTLTRLNYEAVASAATRFLPELRRRPRAALVAFGSVAALRGRGRNVAYAAAKRALQSFFESLRHACAGSTVVVQFYLLGYMDTEQARGLQSRIPKGDPAALSRRVCRDLHRDVGLVYYPGFWRPVAGALRCVPWSIYKRMRF